MTAGHLTLRDGRMVQRGLDLLRALGGIRASYVFQDEFFSYGKMAFSYDEGSQTSPAGPLNDFLSRVGNVRVGFDRYYYFTEAGAWRQAALRHDVFVGDRFHGGIAALQAGLPTILLRQDNRVAELTEHHGLPTSTIEELARKGLAAVLRECLDEGALDRMKGIYRQRHEEFCAEMARQGLKVVTRAAVGWTAAGEEKQRSGLGRVLAAATGWMQGRARSR